MTGQQIEQQPVELKGQDLSDEEYRVYEFGIGYRTVYQIKNPKELYVGKTTHRVVDALGIVHCVPTVGHLGCVLRWKNRAGTNPVKF